MIPAQIQLLRPKTADHLSLRITPSDREYSWEAGQWIDFSVPGQMRMAGYSICSPKGQGTFEILVRRSIHPVTKWLFSDAKIGSSVFISKASGSCIYNPEEHQEIVCFAGGVGITPMISMIRTARRLGKKATLYYAVKDIANNPYPEEIQEGDLFVGTRRLSFSQLCRQHTVDTHFFLCGPRNFIDEGVQTLQQCGYKNIHFERWW